MTELTLGYLDHATGRLILDDELPAAKIIKDDLASLLGAPLTMGCANPLAMEMNLLTGIGEQIQISHDQRGNGNGVWHDSLVEGPGRRSVVRLQGCPIRCAGCWVPETHDANGGYSASIYNVANALLDSAHRRDGVTILGGEPFAQAAALLALVEALRKREPDLHITVYSGYTLQALIARNHEYTNRVLAEIDILIDGRYVKALASSAGPWTGSGNQRIHFLR